MSVVPKKLKLAQQAVKYGPVVYALAQKYGPTLVEQMMKQREPAQKLLEERRTRIRTNPRRLALDHARTLVEGAVQMVFHDGRPHWVVFSRNEPVGVHPRTAASYDTLLLNADPARRMSPDELERTVRLPRRRRGV